MKFKTKGFTSLLLSMLFSLVAVSGVVLYLTPRGRTANWSGWTMLGLDKQTWASLHINVCLLFFFVVALHLLYNWKVLWSYVRKRSAGLKLAGGFNLKWEMLAAALITVVVTAGTIMQSPGLTVTAELNERIKDYWDSHISTGPAPHAEEFTLAEFAENIGLTHEELITTLRGEGVKVVRVDATVGEIAEENAMVPAELFAKLQSQNPHAANRGGERRGMGRGDGEGGGRGMGQGMGRRRGLSPDDGAGQQQ
ncbi:DUF4405 domain-containing protein [Aporhodopirellula aestuarii]|uniref:DUF4405 domain-containing protein n=1 Tax=Aporhodopirellula aestuarii TaxID=2950107 RepID=A0ABT0UDP7_9BACT|nr:DUF4405 domain-containing protein [Aporhodopirellula aestuarii]MCM2374590.1 DUF4405 domain-containing protein [Aporhodopirellula aestuarii]